MNPVAELSADIRRFLDAADRLRVRSVTVHGALTNAMVEWPNGGRNQREWAEAFGREVLPGLRA